MKPKSKKQKGSQFERKIAKKINFYLKEYGIEAKRMPLSGGGWMKGDIWTNKLPVTFECKNQEKWKPLQWFSQVEGENEGSGKIPVVVMSRNRERDFAMLLFDDLLFLMQLALEGGYWVRELSKRKRQSVTNCNQHVSKKLEEKQQEQNCKK